jgi:hypothetical protein
MKRLRKWELHHFCQALVTQPRREYCRPWELPADHSTWLSGMSSELGEGLVRSLSNKLGYLSVIPDKLRFFSGSHVGAQVALALVVALWPVPSSSHATSFTVQPVEWWLGGTEGHRTVVLNARVGHCAGSPKPKVRGVKVRWRRSSAVIELLVRFPIIPDDGRKCGGSLLRLTKMIELEHSVVHRALYDGSTSPPSRRSRAHMREYRSSSSGYALGPYSRHKSQ